MPTPEGTLTPDEERAIDILRAVFKRYQSTGLSDDVAVKLAEAFLRVAITAKASGITKPT